MRNNKKIMLGVSCLLVQFGHAEVTFTSTVRSVEATVDGITDSASSMAAGLFDETVSATNPDNSVTVATSMESTINTANTTEIDFDIEFVQIDGQRPVSSMAPGDLDDGGSTQAVFDIEFTLTSDELFEFSLPFSYNDQSTGSEITLSYDLVQDPAGAMTNLATYSFTTPHPDGMGTENLSESILLTGDMAGTDYKFTLTMVGTGQIANNNQAPLTMTGQIPEPQSVILAGLGLALGLMRRKRG